MKKLFLILLAFLCLSFVLVSCGDEGTTESSNKEEAPTNPVGTKVTKEEWVKAFTFEGINYLAYNYEVTDRDGDKETGTVKYDGSYVYSMEIEDNTSKEEQWQMVPEPPSSEDFHYIFWEYGDYEFGQGVFELLMGYLDYNYDGFSFNEKTGEYSYSKEYTNEYEPEFDFTSSITITFGADKRFSRIDMVRSFKNGEKKTFHYTFTYPSDSIAIPMDRVQSTFNKANDFTDLVFGVRDDATNEMIWHDNMDPTIASILSSLDLSKTVWFKFEQQGSSSTDVNGRIGVLLTDDIMTNITSTVYGKEISYSMIEIDFFQNYRVDAIRFDGYDGSFYIEVLHKDYKY